VPQCGNARASAFLYDSCHEETAYSCIIALCPQHIIFTFISPSIFPSVFLLFLHHFTSSTLCVLIASHPLFSFVLQEWLITTDKVQHVLDLVKLDGERIVNTGNACRSADTCDALVSALVMRSDLFVDGRYAD
jgi:hypothetical protein